MLKIDVVDYNNDDIKIYAPYGLSDIYNRTIRPIKHKYNTEKMYVKKVNSWKKRLRRNLNCSWLLNMKKQVENMSTKNKILLIIILIVYIFVPLLIFVNRDLYIIKFYILSCVGFFIFLLMKIFKVSNKELGITNSNFFKSIKRNIILIVLCLILIIFFKLFHMDKYNSNETLLFYIFYVFISCPI